MSKIYVLYHANCMDGTGSRYAAWKKFKESAIYYAVQYGKPVPEMEPGSRVFILDFSYPKDVLEGLQSVHNEVVVLDHHETAEEALRGVKGCVFDMTKSGAVLSWEYFHPGEAIPDLLLDVQDRDLWQFKRSHSKAVFMGLQLVRNDIETWDSYVTNELTYQQLINTGSILLTKQESDVDSAVKHKVKITTLFGYKVGIINATDNQSEIGNGICKSTDLGVDFAICYSVTNNDDVLLSLRSLYNFNVSAIAAKFGGGGHKNAAGARISIEQLSQLIKGELCLSKT